MRSRAPILSGAWRRHGTQYFLSSGRRQAAPPRTQARLMEQACGLPSFRRNAFLLPGRHYKERSSGLSVSLRKSIKRGDEEGRQCWKIYLLASSFLRRRPLRFTAFSSVRPAVAVMIAVAAAVLPVARASLPMPRRTPDRPLRDVAAERTNRATAANDFFRRLIARTKRRAAATCCFSGHNAG